MVDIKNTTTIRVTNEFKEKLATHGRFGERFEDILLRLLPREFLESVTGDKLMKMYDKKDVDSKKTKRSQKTGRNKNGN